MKYILIVWLYQQGIVVEAHYPDLATCQRFEDKARQWGLKMVTECQALK